MEITLGAIVAIVLGYGIGLSNKEENKETLPKYWTAKEHRENMLECKQMCGNVKFYSSITGECNCNK